MAAVLLVGAGSPFLKILETVLARGWNVCAACDENQLRDLLEAQEPAIVVFEHTHPFDLYELNPRRFGFSGPILLVADEPDTAASELETETFVKRRSDLASLLDLIDELTGVGR